MLQNMMGRQITTAHRFLQKIYLEFTNNQYTEIIIEEPHPPAGVFLRAEDPRDIDLQNRVNLNGSSPLNFAGKTVSTVIPTTPSNAINLNFNDGTFARIYIESVEGQFNIQGELKEGKQNQIRAELF